MTEVAPTEIESLRPLLAVAVSGVAVFLILLSRKRPALREGWTISAALLKFGLVLSMAPDALAGREHVTDLGTLVPGVEFAFRADPLGLLFGLVASGLYVVTAVYSIGYCRELDEHQQTRFFAALAASLSATMGVAFATNLLVLFLFYELLTIATYPLVAHEETQAARLAGYKYLAYGLTGGVVIVFGTLIVFAIAGTVTFTPGGMAALATTDPWVGRAVFGILVVGFGVKAAIMPLHAWLPSAMVAPTPVSGLLHAVAVVKSGVFGITRVITDVFGPGTVSDLGMDLPLALAAGATILVGSLLALRQDNLKRLLAYSTIAQLSYIVLGVALVTPTAIAGGLLHLPAHAFAKLTLFFCAGALYVELGVRDVSDMAGVGRRMPLTMGTFAIASCSMAGIPLLAGFVSKWYLVLGGASAGQPLVVVLLVVSGLLNVAYFWPVIYTAFFETADSTTATPVLMGPYGGGDATATARTDGGWERRTWRGDETSWLLLVPILTTAGLVVGFGILVESMFFFDAVSQIVERATGVGLGR